MATAAASRRSLLLVEPQSMLRRTIVAVARELRLADLHEATSVEAARRLMTARRFDALLIALDDDGAALELLAQLRSGQTLCESDVPVAVMAAIGSAETVMSLKNLDVRRLLLMPFKVKSVLEVISGLWAPAGAAPSRPARPTSSAPLALPVAET